MDVKDVKVSKQRVNSKTSKRVCHWMFIPRVLEHTHTAFWNVLWGWGSNKSCSHQCLFGGFVELDDGLMGNTFNILTYLALDGEIF